MLELEKEIPKRDRGKMLSRAEFQEEAEENYKLFTTSTYSFPPVICSKKKTSHRWKRKRKAWNVRGKNSISWPWTFIFLSASSSSPVPILCCSCFVGHENERRRKKRAVPMWWVVGQHKSLPRSRSLVRVRLLSESLRRRFDGLRSFVSIYPLDLDTSLHLTNKDTCTSGWRVYWKAIIVVEWS